MATSCRAIRERIRQLEKKPYYVCNMNDAMYTRACKDLVNRMEAAQKRIEAATKEFDTLMTELNTLKYERSAAIAQRELQIEMLRSVTCENVRMRGFTTPDARTNLDIPSTCDTCHGSIKRKEDGCRTCSQHVSHVQCAMREERENKRHTPIVTDTPKRVKRESDEGENEDEEVDESE